MKIDKHICHNLDELLALDCRYRITVPQYQPQQNHTPLGPLLAALPSYNSTHTLKTHIFQQITLKEYQCGSRTWLEDEQFLQQVQQNWDLKGFQKYLLMMASLVLKKRIIVYLSAEGNLITFNYNFGFDSVIEIARHNSCYDLVQPLDSPELYDLSNISGRVQSSQGSNSKSNSYKQRHKKSMSDSSMLQAFLIDSKLFNIKHNKEQELTDLPEQDQSSANQLQSICKFMDETANPQQVQDRIISKYTGRLKFFDQGKNYGFIIMDEDHSDIFVHYDDLQKASISRQTLKAARHGSHLRFEFQCMSYVGKYQDSRKAIELSIIEESSPY